MTEQVNKCTKLVALEVEESVYMGIESRHPIGRLFIDCGQK